MTPVVEKRVEDPVRLARFLDATSGLRWGPSERSASLDQLCAGVNALAQAEIAYYYRQRRRTRVISTVARLFAWIFGTAGLLAPLVEAAIGKGASGASGWGYVMLALAASALTANSLFDGSDGHARNVRAQLDLERSLTLFRFEWLAARALMNEPPSDEQVTRAFAILSSFGASIYTTLGAETAQWVSALERVVAEFEHAVKGSRKSAV